MSSRDAKDLHPALQELWTALVPLVQQELGLLIALSTTYRSNTEQARLYAQGRTTPGNRVTNAMPGQSAHNVAPPEGSHAFDFAVLDGAGNMTWKNVSQYIAVANIARRLGADCGAFWSGFTDNPHVQMPGWEIGKVYGPNYRFLVKARPPVPLTPKGSEDEPAPVPTVRVRLSQKGAPWSEVIAGKRVDTPTVTVNFTDPTVIWVRTK